MGDYLPFSESRRGPKVTGAKLRSLTQRGQVWTQLTDTLLTASCQEATPRLSGSTHLDLPFLGLPLPFAERQAQPLVLSFCFRSW